MTITRQYTHTINHATMQTWCFRAQRFLVILRTLGIMTVLLALSMPVQAADTASKRWLGPSIYFGGQAADFTSTRIGIRRPGISEGNTLAGQGPTKQAIVNVASAAALTWADAKIGQRSKTGQRIMRVTFLIFSGWKVQHNLRIQAKR